MSKLVLNLDHLDETRDVALEVMRGIMSDAIDLQKAGRALEAVGKVQHDAKLRLQAAVILGDSETLSITGRAIAAPVEQPAGQS